MASKRAYALKSDELWNAYQTAQGSADHSARECFNEVVGLEIAQRIKLLEDEIEAQVQHRLVAQSKLSSWPCAVCGRVGEPREECCEYGRTAQAWIASRSNIQSRLDQRGALLREYVEWFDSPTREHGWITPPLGWLKRVREQKP